MRKLAAFAAITLALPSGVFAHHGSNAQFDRSRPVEVSGVVTDIGFVNPHAYVYFDVTDENGNVVNWHCELRGANVLRRSGWTKEMFEAGTAIVVTGNMSRKEDNGCYVETIALGGAQAFSRYDDFEENMVTADTDRPETTPWGDPYIAGHWVNPARGPGGPGGPGGMGPGGPSGPGGPGGPGGMGPGGMGPGGLGASISAIELTDAGTEGLAEILRVAEENGVDVIHTTDCHARDIFGDWTFDGNPNQIIQEEDTITLKYGFFDTVRTIHMNMDEHPANITRSFTGHSIGRWEGDVLVVDTIGFEAKAITGGDPNVVGVMSEQYHTVERFSVDNEKGELTNNYEATDPLFWVDGAKQTGQSTVVLSDLPWESFACDDRTVQ